MDHKHNSLEAQVADLESEMSEKQHGLLRANAGTVAHVFQEDSEGRVTERLLLPRPTEDPKDPLTWTLWRKHFALTTTCFFVFLSNWITASVIPILIPIVHDFDIGLTEASYLITFNILFLGIGNLFWVPLSLKIGKRPVLILCSAIFFASSTWAATAQSWSSLFGARIIQGFGASASEALGPSVVADLYFLHERGTKVGLYTLAIASGSALGGIFAGLVAHANPDWRKVFWMNVALTGACFVCTVLFLAETNFKRPAEFESGEGLESSKLASIKARAKPSWWKSMNVTDWYDRILDLVALGRPFRTLQYPAVVWGSLTYGVTLGWVVLQQTANASAFVEIYGYSELAIGNINIANLIGAIVGCLAGGTLTDIVAASISKRRDGFFKPEFRLWCLIVPFLFGPIGLLMWGFGLEKQLNPFVAIAGSGISYAVLSAVPSVGITYVVDSYRPFAGETMTMLNAFKNTFAFALSFAVTPWVEKDGYAKVSGYATLIEGLIFATTIPMYLYGERIRQWTTKFVV